MRWKEKPEVIPQVGSQQSKTRFLLLPLTIGNETRWLEKATWRETYIKDKVWSEIGETWLPYYKWRPTEWINN